MAECPYINESLRHLAIAIDSIHPDPANERIHDDRNMAAIKGSIARFGQHQVVTVWKEKGIIVAGNGRWKAMKELGYEFIAANIKSMTETQAALLRIVDNRTSELSYFDRNALEETIKLLSSNEYNLDDLGFSQSELTEMIGGGDFEQWEPTDNDESKGSAVYSEKVVISIAEEVLRQPIKDMLLTLIKDNGWESKAEIL